MGNEIFLEVAEQHREQSKELRAEEEMLKGRRIEERREGLSIEHWALWTEDWP